MEAAQARGATAERLRRLLQGDLSAILLKAVESDPLRRYGSVRQFADDVLRYLDGRSWWRRDRRPELYRVAKFWRRLAKL